jgi:chromosome segregation ATPase
MRRDGTKAREQLRTLQQRIDSEKSTSNQVAATADLTRALEQELRQSQAKVAELTSRERERESRMRAVAAENAGLTACNAKLMRKVKSLGLKVDALRAGVSPDLQEVGTQQSGPVKVLEERP